jgi:hypothetical protein
MQPSHFETEARVIYQLCGCDCSRPAPIATLAKCLGATIRAVPGSALPGDAALATVHGERRVYVRRGLPPQRLKFAVAHELGHLALGLDSSTLENEDQCDALAACLLVPGTAFQAALSRRREWGAIASCFGTSESFAALRFGEVTGVPLALVAPSRVRVRGAAYDWPSNLGEPIPGVRKIRIGDDSTRLALVA